MRTLSLATGLLLALTSTAFADTASEFAKELVRSGATGSHLEPRSGKVYEVHAPVEGVTENFLVIRRDGAARPSSFAITPQGRIAKVWHTRALPGGRRVEHARTVESDGGGRDTFIVERTKGGFPLLTEEYSRAPGGARQLVSATRFEHRGTAPIHTTVKPGEITRSWTAGYGPEGNVIVKSKSTRTRLSDKQLLATVRASAPAARTAPFRASKR